MATASSRRSKGGDSPQIESLRDPRDLRAEVSPQSYRTYDEKRSDYVERPGWGPNGWDQLASALAKFNPVLDRMAAAQNARLVDEYAARGKEEMNRSKQDWKEFLEANPAYQGVSPHFERGYKAAELNSKGQSLQAAMQDYYTTNSFASETDPAKVQKAMAEFSKTWTQQNVKYGDYDSDTYVDNYLRLAQQAESSMLSRHTNDRSQEHVKLALEKHSQNFVMSVDTVFDSTPDIANPDVMNVAMASLAERAMGHMAEMEASGLTKSQSTAVIMDGILQLAKAEGYEGHGKEILSLADLIKTGSGTISGRPEFRAKVKDMLEGWERDKRQKRSEDFANYERNRSYQAHNATDRLNQYLSHCEKQKTEPSMERMLELAGPNHTLIAMSIQGTYQAHKQNPINWDTSKHLEYEVDRQLVLNGQMTYEQSLGLYKIYGSKAAAHIELARKVQDGSDPVTNAQASPAATRGIATLDAQIGAIFNDGQDTLFTDKEQTKTYKVEARGRMYREIQVFVDDYIAKHKVPPSQSKLDIFIEDKVQEIGRSYQLRKKAMTATGHDSDPVLIEKPGNEPERSESHWQLNTVKFFGEDTTEIQAINTALQAGQKEQVLAGLQNKYGYSREQILWMLNNQFKLYGIVKQPAQPGQEPEKTPTQRAKEAYDAIDHDSYIE